MISIPSSNPLHSNADSINVTGSCTDGMLVSISGDISASDVLSPIGALSQTCLEGSFNYTLKKVVDGSYQFGFRQTDFLDSGELTFQWDRDTKAADQIISSSPTNPDSGVDSSFIFSSTDGGAAFECQLDSAGWAPCSSPVTYSALVDGPHAFSVRATDLASNTNQAPSYYSWVRQTPAFYANVASVAYALSGGKAGDKNLDIDLVIKNESGATLAASVTAELGYEGTFLSSATGASIADGVLTKLLSEKSSGVGCFTVLVADVTSAGYNWDGSTVTNSFCKP